MEVVVFGFNPIYSFLFQSLKYKYCLQVCKTWNC